MSEEVQNVSEPDPEPEPEGLVEVEVGGQKVKMAPVGVIAAERKRAREKTEQTLRAEFEPVKQKAAEADRLAADLATLQPHIEYLQKHPELTQQAQAPDVLSVSDEEAEKEARELELYTPTGLDVTRAKRIIAKRRAETKQVAAAAAKEAIQPYAQSSFTAAARQNFVWAASQNCSPSFHSLAGNPSVSRSLTRILNRIGSRSPSRSMKFSTLNLCPSRSPPRTVPE